MNETKKKILLCGMALDIGGAETHMTELAKELSRTGYDVIAASNGGVYVKELEEAGVKHVTLPLHNKSVPSILRSLAGLRSLIKREKPDIVHAHARIPAFICGLLARSMKFRFVTTVHGTYKTTPLWTLISDWGEKALAPSCDLKQYLIENYKMPSDNITVTVNGIDTTRFAPAQSDAETESELRLSGAHRIIHVSRIDTESSYTAKELIKAMDKVCASYPDAQLVIIGDGSDMHAVSELAEKANARVGRQCVVLAGRRTDVCRILSCGNLFVGVSRAALEAMACGLPIILSGSPEYGQGYGGIFDENMLSEAMADNFCCRSCPEDAPHSLADDVLKIFSLSRDEIEAMGEYNRSVVIKNYSVSRMTQDAISVYSSLTPKKRCKYGDVIISGYYGYNNMGDDSLLASMIATLKKREPNIRITVLSKRPSETRRLFGVASINRFNPFSLFIAMRRAKILISGGGSLLQNETSNRSLNYYITIIKLAKMMGLKVAVYASGIGPVHGDKFRARTSAVLEIADSITLREGSSLEEIRSMKVKNENVSVTADPVFAMASPDSDWIRYIMKQRDLIPEKDYFAVSLRSWHASSEDFEDKICALCKRVSEKYGMTALFIPLQISRDLAICERMALRCNGILVKDLTASEFTGIISNTKFVIGMRLHSLIYTARAGVPFIGLSYDPKVNALAKELDIPYVADVVDVDTESLVAMADEIMENRSEISEKIKTKASELALRTETDSLTIARMLSDM